jgi:hypothetical protein
MFALLRAVKPAYQQVKAELGRKARWIKLKTIKKNAAAAASASSSPASASSATTSSAASSSGAGKGKRKRDPADSSDVHEEDTDAEIIHLWDEFSADVVREFLLAIDKEVIASYGRGTRMKEKLQAFAELLTSIGKAAYMLTENYKDFGAPVSALLNTFKAFGGASSQPSRSRLSAGAVALTEEEKESAT